MNTPSEMSASCNTPLAAPTEAPSADFIHAISEFLDTDPADLLVELGYYARETDAAHALSAAAQD